MLLSYRLRSDFFYDSICPRIKKFKMENMVTFNFPF